MFHRIALLVTATLVGIVASGCGNALLPSTDPPSVGLSMTSTSAITAGIPVAFAVSAASPNVANVFLTNIRVDFGDGAFADLGATAGTVAHAYSVAGAYTATATATDTSGNQGRASLAVFVGTPSRPPAPSVGLTSNAANPTTAGTLISFTVTASVPGGNSATTFIQSIHLDFGDGFAIDLGGASATVTHSYSTAGTFTVTAIATDTVGNQGRALLSIVVTLPAKPAGPSVGLFFSPSTPVPAGYPVTFTVTATMPGNPPTVFIKNIHLDFGDGQSADLGAAAPSGGVYHAYATKGPYTATVIAVDSSGNEGKASLTVVIP